MDWVVWSNQFTWYVNNDLQARDATSLFLHYCLKIQCVTLLHHFPPPAYNVMFPSYPIFPAVCSPFPIPSPASVSTKGKIQTNRISASQAPPARDPITMCTCSMHNVWLAFSATSLPQYCIFFIKKMYLLHITTTLCTFIFHICCFVYTK